MSQKFNSFIFIILFSLSLQDEVSEKLINSLKSLKPQIQMEIQISSEYIKAKRQQQKTIGNNSIYKSMEHTTVETYWRYPKPVLRKPESSAQEEAPRKKIQQKNVPNFMKPLDRKKQQVEPNKKEDKKHEVLDVELIVPGNVVSVQEAQKEIPVEDREINYIGFLQKAKFLFNFLFVDLVKYRKYNYLQLGSSKKYHDFNLIDRKDKFHDTMFPNIQFWLYSQEKNLNFYTLRAIVDNEYRFFNEFHQEQLIYERKGSFFGPRVGNCWNDPDIFTSYEKAIAKFTTIKKIKIQYKGQTFNGELKEVSNSKLNFLTIKVIQSEDRQLKEAKRDFIDQITTMQMSKQQLNQIGYLGRFNKDDKCYYDLNFAEETSDLELTFMFKIVENDWNKLNAVYTAHKNQVTQNCQVIQNVIYSQDYLGYRVKNKDLEVTFARRDKNFYLKAYQQQDRINYVVVYDINRQYFFNENVYDSVMTLLKKNNIKVDGCVYHNDNYLLDKDFNEVYMITFYSKLSEQEIALNRSIRSKRSQKSERKQNLNLELDFNHLYEVQSDQPLNQQKLELQKSQSNVSIPFSNQVEDVALLKETLKYELKNEIKSEIIQELKQYFDNKRLI